MGGLEVGVGGVKYKESKRKANRKSDVQGWENGGRYFIGRYDKHWLRTSLPTPKYKQSQSKIFMFHSLQKPVICAGGRKPSLNVRKLSYQPCLSQKKNSSEHCQTLATTMACGESFKFSF